ncbi:homocysteine S-methyltransferase family protein [Roseomonas sp. GC11]|uniref:homocysteine S-methyltransferase family protein n=1 Tax=Roseomonas sp. GC11 TaxID=2950546 RepID=UPI00210CF44A|nr:homocysteine S-methyltransferase family protein [Roseomonas sp. GC11]MCQ4160346.1 homocysteine S-methyltransferase family protein [Roseomonas sp. GC11]
MPQPLLILDGGMSRELMRLGAPFRQPEWSALALIEAPDFVRQAHANYIAAGAEVVTTNSYALVPFHIGEARFAAEGRALAARSGELARQAAQAAPHPVRVAGSLPPLFGSYRPDLFDAAAAPALLAELIAGLAPHVDLWLAETQSSIAEVEAVRAALAGDDRPLWISFTLQDEPAAAAGVIAGTAPARLRSGEAVGEAVAAALRLGAAALLFNCSQAEIMLAALREARQALDAAGAAALLGVYANAFVPQPKTGAANEGLSAIRPDLDPAAYLAIAQGWAEAGAGIIGGCCGIGPEHIAALATGLRA